MSVHSVLWQDAISFLVSLRFSCFICCLVSALAERNLNRLGRFAFPPWGRMDWTGLEGLGVKFLESVKRIYKEPRFLFFAIDCPEDAQGLLQDIFGDLEVGPLGEEGVQVVLKWKTSMEKPCARLTSLHCMDSFSHLRHPGHHPERTVQEEFEEIVRDSPSYVLELAKRRLKRKREHKGLQRAELENEQRNIYALQLAEVVKEACLPVTFQLELLQDPNRAWIRIFGNRRSKTLRNRLRAWQKFRSWYLAFAGLVWPKSIAPLVAYVEERIDEGCSYSCPGELQAALTVLEQVGRVPEDKRCSNDATWMAHLSSWKLELETRSRVPKPAKPYTVAILVSLEVFVMDEEHEVYFRFIAWTILLACWTSMRVDDIQNVLPETLKISRRGFTARLARTKTSGPGKLHGQLPIFVRRETSLTGHDWLATGFEFTRMDSFLFPRDYLVPAHNDAWDGFFPKLIEPPALSNLMRMVLGKLGTPRFQDGIWRTNKAMLLVPGDLLLFWTGHSARHFLNQAALALGVPKERRDYLGRWAVGRTGSNAYIHTARQVVESIQLDVVKALTTGSAEIDETELLDQVAQFADDHGLVGHRIRRRHTQQLARDLPVLNSEDPDTEAETDNFDVHEVGNLVEEIDRQEDRVSSKYFVTVSRRTGLRRLHAHFKCPVRSQRCLDSFDVTSIDETTFDVMCRICKRRLQLDEGKLETDSSSTSGESSSTESEKAPEPQEEALG